MKYKLLQALPGYGIGYIIDTDDITQVKFLKNPENFPDFFEEVKENKTIYDLEEGDEYWYLDRALNVKKNTKDDNFYPAHAFLTEREAKRNKLLRELATRTDKWLPKNDEYYYTPNRYGDMFQLTFGDSFDIYQYHCGLVFRNEEEYNRYMTDEARDLLFNK